MNFFDKLFGKQEVEKKDEKTLEFSKLAAWLEKERKERSEKSYKETKPIVKKISSALSEIKEIAEGMKENEISGDIPQRARKVILVSAPMFVQSLTDSVSFDYKTDIVTFQKTLDLCLDKIGKLLVGKGRYLPIAFSDEIERIGKRANDVLNYRDELRKRIPKDEKRENVMNVYGRINGYFEKLRELEKNLKKTNANLEELKKEKPSLEKNLRAIEKSNELREFLNGEEDLKRLKSETDEIRNKVNNYLSPLQRPLKKFEKFSEESEKDCKEIDRYIETPVEEFFLDENFSIEDILGELNEAILLKKIELKPQEEKKVFYAFENLEELKKLGERYKEIMSDEKNKKTELTNSGIANEKNEILKEIESVNKNIEVHENELNKIKTNISELKENILQEKKVLEEFIGEIEGSEISITVDFQV